MSAIDAAVVRELGAARGEPSDTSTPWIASGVVVVLTRALFISVGAAGAWLLASGPGSSGTLAFDEMWRRWDAHHFLTIAEHGYTSPSSDAHAAAFFPGFPLAVRAIMFFGLPPVAAGMLVSAVACLVAGAFLYKLAELDAGRGAGRRALLYLSVFPTAVFLVAPYSESLFLAGAIPAFYLARRRRWHLVGIPAAVAMGARAAGIFLLVGLAVEFLRQRDLTPTRLANGLLALVIGALPLLAYGAFLSQAMGDPFMFQVHQREGWGRTFVGPVAAFHNTWNTWDVQTYPTNWLLAWRIEILAAAIGIAATAWALRKREWGYGAFMGSMMGVLLSSTWYYSIPRMLLTMFPIVIFAAAATRKRPVLHEWIVIALAPLAALGVLVYTQGEWFY